MYTCAITLSMSFDDAVPQDLDVRVSISDMNAANNTIQQDVEVGICDVGGARGTVVAFPATRLESAPARMAAQREEDDYVLGGYAGI